MADGTPLDYTRLAAPYSPEKEELIAVLHPVWTTANLADASHRVNTKDKFAGKPVWDSTLGEMVFASGAAAADAWYTAAELAPQPSATTAELADVGDAINTTNKSAGKIVWNSDTSTLVYAVGAAAADAWNGVHDQLLDHSPV